MRELAAWLDGQGRTVAAFLELAQPAFGAAVQSLVDEGFTHLRVLPLFLNSGRHVGRDVPALIAAALEASPHVSIEVLPHIGAGEAFRAFVLQSVTGP